MYEEQQVTYCTCSNIRALELLIVPYSAICIMAHNLVDMVRMLTKGVWIERPLLGLSAGSGFVEIGCL